MDRVAAVSTDLAQRRDGIGGLIVSLPATGEINSEWRIYARGASDDKAGVMGILTAFDALRPRNSRRQSISNSYLKVKKKPGRRIWGNHRL
jgi:hypothetical protein